MIRPVSVLTLTVLLASCSPSDAPDMVVYGRIWTGDSTQPWTQGVAIRGNRIVALGDRTSLGRLAGSKTTIIDNRSNLVTPGLMDDHTHFFGGGLRLHTVPLRDADTPAEFIRRIGERALATDSGQWVLGGGWDHEQWEGAPLPERAWIDSVSPNNPVFLTRLDGHMGVANSAALRLAGIDRTTRVPAGGEIVRISNGEPAGVFKDAAMSLITEAIPAISSTQLDSALSDAVQHAVSLGLTGVSVVSATWNEVAALHRAVDRNALPIRVVVYLSLNLWREAADSLRVNGPGDLRLRIAGVKGYVDGSLGSTTALFDAPYSDAPRTRGLAVTSWDSLASQAILADSAGLQLAIHAIGDRANGLLLDLLATLDSINGPRDRRARIEHAQHLRPEDIPRFRQLGVIASMQPYHAIDDGRWAEKRIGRARIRTTYAFQSLLQAGATLAFGSDWTVAPLSPVSGLYAAVTRRTLDGLNPEGWVPTQKITLDQALRAYTAANAWATFRERDLGVLRVGALADLTLFDRDLSQVPSDQIMDAAINATIVDGRVVYQAEQEKPATDG